jgi:DNA-binding transcriptional ArsR family regulator
MEVQGTQPNNGYEMGSIRAIGPDSFKLLEDETRRRIVSLLVAGEMTVGQIAEALKMTPQNVYQQVRKLVGAGLVRVARRVVSGHLIESHYRAVAENFYFADEEREREGGEDACLEILLGLRGLGHDVEANEEKARRLAEAMSAGVAARRSPTYEMCTGCSSSGVFLKLGSADSLKNDTLLGLEGLMTMTDEEFEEGVEAKRRLRGFLRSILRGADN